MKFNCGDTIETKKAKDRKRLEERKLWHRVFLFWPTTIGEKDGKHVCLMWCWVERCFPYAYATETYHTYGIYMGNPVYREITK